MSDTARRIWLCADDYGISPGVNRAIRDLIAKGRLNATSAMVVAPALGRDEVAAVAASFNEAAVRIDPPLGVAPRPDDGYVYWAN